MSGDQKGARQLLDHGANVHVRNRQGETPLQEASKWKNEDIVQLFQFGAESS